jgi:glycosyltransferase involved in cell wall biosynthesis
LELVLDISFIIISRSDDTIQRNLENLKRIISNSKLSCEIILALGNNPSVQRNKAAEEASGEWLYFLDDDSELDEQSLDYFVIAKNKYPDAFVFGGPSLLRSHKLDIWQEAVQMVFTSDVGVGPIRSRYLSLGPTRFSSERELILCNLIIKKMEFYKLGGFKPELYPNEENEFLSRIGRTNAVVYSPLIVVYRKHRETMLKFAEQMIGYGKGRTRHFLFSSDYRDYVYFLPLAGLAILSSLVILNFKLKIVMALLALYFIIITPTILINCIYKKSTKLFLNGVVVFGLCHVGYAIGLLIGFFDKKSRAASVVEVKKEQ